MQDGTRVPTDTSQHADAAAARRLKSDGNMSMSATDERRGTYVLREPPEALPIPLPLHH